LKTNPKHLFVLLLSIVMFIIGFVFLLNSATIGSGAARRMISPSGMDTAEYHILIENSIEAYRWTGAILVTNDKVGVDQ
jgi:hypothetical protein